MLVLATLHRLLSQVISSPGLHTAALLTPNGQLVSYACDSTRSKDDVRLVVGLSSEIWLEVADQGIGMVDSEVSTSLSLMPYFGALIDVIAHSLTSSGASSSWAFKIWSRRRTRTLAPTLRARTVPTQIMRPINL
jgi:hypothetical protein